MRSNDMEPNLKHYKREGNALYQMCGSVAFEWQKRGTADAYNYLDNRIHSRILPKGTAQEGHEYSDDIESIQSAALDECEYD